MKTLENKLIRLKLGNYVNRYIKIGFVFNFIYRIKYVLGFFLIIFIF